ncbi:T9SS type A sorting domain-containing protein [Spirosoma foliorum]|uniref:T9SS type A sorting domain-containing protein n=1 Tax=Spirosoma foliorum TaxID=2710596 RepID=UPI001F0AD490|nr:T9SS type A sorting domain-containing protein [Spirosoma foliorum]
MQTTLNRRRGGGGKRGAAPELAGVGAQAASFVKLARQYANGMPVWITETGYDINQGSPFHALSTGRKTALETQADWILRTALLFSRVGIDRVFFFQAYDDNPANPVQFSSMGLLNTDKTRKPAADYIYQAMNLLGDYRYKESLKPVGGPSDLLIDRYELNGRSSYVLMIPDERDRTDTYTLAIPKGDTVQICTPTAGRDQMTRRIQVSQTGTIRLSVSETPVFVVPVSISAPDLSTLQFVSAPSTNSVDLLVENNSLSPVEISVYNSTGQRFRQVSLPKSGRIFRTQLDLRQLPKGNYLLAVQQGKARVVRKWVKAQ